MSATFESIECGGVSVIMLSLCCIVYDEEGQDFDYFIVVFFVF